jgi:UDP-glucose 4-epimerase
MSRILITGGAGFLGSHLIDALASSTHELVAVDNLRRGRLDFIQDNVDSGRVDFFQVDIRDTDAVTDVMRGVDIVFHLAAQSNVMGSMSDPDYSFQTNVVGTYNVLKAAAEAGVKRLVFSSSREAYGEPIQLPVREDDMLRPKNPYGASKLAGEAYCRAFDGTSGLSCGVLRFGNLYGTRDSGRVIPIWLSKAQQGEDLVIYGGEQVLDFVLVRYAVAALIATAESDFFGPVNVATGRGTSLLDLALKILSVTLSNSRTVIEPPRSAEVVQFVADVSRMKHLLKIDPPADPLLGLAEMVAPAAEPVVS